MCPFLRRMSETSNRVKSVIKSEEELFEIPSIRSVSLLMIICHHSKRDKTITTAVIQWEPTGRWMSRLRANVLAQGRRGFACHVRWRPNGRRRASVHCAALGPDSRSMGTEWGRLISVKGPEGFITISQQTIVPSLGGEGVEKTHTHTHSNSSSLTHLMVNIGTHPWVQNIKGIYHLNI